MGDARHVLREDALGALVLPRPAQKRVPWLPKTNCWIDVGMVRNARVTCQNNCRLIASTTEWAVPGRMMNWRSPFGSLL